MWVLRPTPAGLPTPAGVPACAEGKEGEKEAPKDGDKFLGAPAALGQLALLSGILGIGALLANLGRPDVQEISFQHFKTHLLGAGVVDRVEVTNKTSAKVFVRPSGSRCGAPAKFGHFFHSSWLQSLLGISFVPPSLLIKTSTRRA